MTDRRTALPLLLSLALAGCGLFGGDDDERGDETIEDAPAHPPLPDAPALAAGDDVTCAVNAQGAAFCWGRNLDGELGDGTGQNRRTPVPVRNVTEAHQLAPGRQHTCALKRDGTVWCWGRNDHGQLGDGSTDASAEAVQVAGLTDAIQVATGSEFSCAARRGGQVSCWGHGANGRLGNGATDDSGSPVEVSGLTDAQRVDLGASHACALKSDGTLWCWGSDSQGQVGQEGDSMRAFNQATQVAGLAGVTDFSAGGDNTCAVTGGALHCWGDNYYGKVGNGQSGQPTDDAQVPVAVASLAAGVAEIGVGVYHVCARLEAGGVRCWGDDGYGNIGAAERGDRAEPTEVAQMSDAQQLAVGSYHACVVRQTGAISCWGKGGDGQLGAETIEDGYHPGDRIASLAELSAEAPAIEAFEPDASRAGARTPMVSLGSSYGCGVRDDGHVLCWGANGSGQLGVGNTLGAYEQAVEVPGITDAVEVRASGSAACARRANGAVACWGALGRINGAPSFVRSSRPVGVQGVTDAKQIALGGSSLCVLHEPGTVSCQHNDAMTPVEGLSGVAEIASGGSTTCARLEEGGGVRCWGSGNYGQLGNGEESASFRTPVEVTGVSGATQLAFGSSHACALAGGQVWCWGNNRYGQVGNGRSGEDEEVLTPVAVRGLRNVQEIAAGPTNTLARLEDGSVMCWGYNRSNQCGLGQTDDNRVDEVARPQPVAAGDEAQMAPLGPPRQMAVGQSSACVLHETGRLSCWGSSSVLGQGSFGGLVRSRAAAPRPLTQVALASGGPAIAAVPVETGTDTAEEPTEEAPTEEATEEEPTEEPPTEEAPEARPTADPEAAHRNHRSLVERAVRRSAQGCYQRLGTRGPVTVRVVVGADGRVVTSQVVNNSTGNQEVGRCISGAMVGQRFTNPRRANVTFDIPFSG